MYEVSPDLGTFAPSTERRYRYLENADLLRREHPILGNLRVRLPERVINLISYGVVVHNFSEPQTGVVGNYEGRRTGSQSERPRVNA